MKPQRKINVGMRGNSLKISLVLMLVLSTTISCYAAGEQQKTPPQPPDSAVKIQIQEGAQNTVSYNYSPGTPIVLTGDNGNIIMTANNQVQLQYSAENTLQLRYLGVDVESEKPLTLQIRGDYKPEEAPTTSDSARARAWMSRATWSLRASVDSGL